MSERSSIVGHWLKTTRVACAEKYPDELAFAPDQLYTAQSRESPGKFLLWSGGDYEWVDHAGCNRSQGTGRCGGGGGPGGVSP